MERSKMFSMSNIRKFWDTPHEAEDFISASTTEYNSGGVLPTTSTLSRFLGEGLRLLFIRVNSNTTRRLFIFSTSFYIPM